VTVGTFIQHNVYTRQGGQEPLPEGLLWLLMTGTSSFVVVEMLMLWARRREF
jgi:hypothetical protein